MTAPFEMLGFWRSQATFRLRVAFNLKGLAYRETPVDLDAGAQNTDAFRATSPQGGVPVVMADGTALTQSLAILEYLEESYPEPALLPADPLGRARVRALAALVAADSHPLIVPRVRRYLAEHAGFGAPQWKAWQTHWFGTGLSAFEARLQDSATGTYCHGETPTIADISLCGLLASAKTFKLDLPDVPTVTRIVDTCMALPAFDAARAEKQADYPGQPLPFPRAEIPV